MVAAVTSAASQGRTGSRNGWRCLRVRMSRSFGCVGNCCGERSVIAVMLELCGFVVALLLPLPARRYMAGTYSLAVVGSACSARWPL